MTAKLLRRIAVTVVVTFVTAMPARAQDTADDMAQYVPYASLVAMKALGLESAHDWPRLLATAAGSWVVTAGVTYTLKHSMKEWRPDHTDQRSFPSGHATIAFAGATALRHEFGHLSPWVTVGGYAVATLTAADRVRRDRHHWYDVCAGAAIGVVGTELTYYASSRLFPSSSVRLGVSPSALALSFQW